MVLSFFVLFSFPLSLCVSFWMGFPTIHLCNCWKNERDPSILSHPKYLADCPKRACWLEAIHLSTMCYLWEIKIMDRDESNIEKKRKR